MVAEGLEVDGMQVRIRRANFRDLPQVIGLLTNAGLSIEGVTEHFKNFYVAEERAELVGVAGIQTLNYIGLLRSTAVMRGFRNRGVGKLLIKAAVNHARELGLDELYLLTFNQRDYFCKLGFEPVERTTVPEVVQGTVEYRELCIGAECMRIALLSA